MKLVKAIILASTALCLTACGSKEGKINLSTPEKSIETAMTALKDMDLKTFNNCTDNYVATYTNWIGIPVEREYKIFNELLQPGVKRRKEYQSDKELAKKIVENLTWEVNDIRVEGSSAEMELLVTNKDMTDVMGNYTIELLEDMVESDGIGIGQLAGSLWALGTDKSEIISSIDATDRMITVNVMVRLTKNENGSWVVGLDDELINALMGNIDSEEYSGDIEKNLKVLENKYEEKMEKWAEEMEDKVDQWFD